MFRKSCNFTPLTFHYDRKQISKNLLRYTAPNRTPGILEPDPENANKSSYSLWFLWITTKF